MDNGEQTAPMARPVQRMLHQIAPESQLIAITPFVGDQPGEYTNETFFVDFELPNQTRRRVVIKRYIPCGEHYANKAQVDVGYCLMDMYLVGEEQAAKQFLRTYENARGRKTANLGFWQLAAAVRPIQLPVGWISEPVARERFRRFITDALTRK